MRKLNDRQKAFCEEYMVDMNATQAAIRAGYSKKYARQNAPKLLQNTTVATYLKNLIDARSERTEIKADDVLADLRELADMCMGRKATPKSIIVDDSIINAEAFEFNAAGANKALESLSKYLKLFDTPVKIQFSGDLSDKGAQVLDALGKGELSPGEASTVMSALQAQSRLVESDDLIARIERLEKEK